MWYYIKIGDLIFSHQDYFIMKQLVEESNDDYVIQETAEDLSDCQLPPTEVGGLQERVSVTDKP